MQPITEAMELFRHQRAIRAWADRPVPDELVRQVLQAAIHAPSGSNTQPWHFIVVRDQAVKDRLTAIYDNALGEVQGVPTPPSDSDRQPLSAAPVLIVACVDTPRLGARGVPDRRVNLSGLPEPDVGCASTGASNRTDDDIGSARPRSTRSWGYPTVSRARRSSRSAGRTGPTDQITERRWSSSSATTTGSNGGRWLGHAWKGSHAKVHETRPQRRRDRARTQRTRSAAAVPRRARRQ